jgi:hypothetical protein
VTLFLRESCEVTLYPCGEPTPHRQELNGSHNNRLVYTSRLSERVVIETYLHKIAYQFQENCCIAFQEVLVHFASDSFSGFYM